MLYTRSTGLEKWSHIGKENSLFCAVVHLQATHKITATAAHQAKDNVVFRH